jgi:hypothetical protein
MLPVTGLSLTWLGLACTPSVSPGVRQAARHQAGTLIVSTAGRNLRIIEVLIDMVVASRSRREPEKVP